MGIAVAAPGIEDGSGQRAEEWNDVTMRTEEKRREAKGASQQQLWLSWRLRGNRGRFSPSRDPNANGGTAAFAHDELRLLCFAGSVAECGHVDRALPGRGVQVRTMFRR